MQSEIGCSSERPHNCCAEAEEKLILILQSIPAWAGSARAQGGWRRVRTVAHVPSAAGIGQRNAAPRACLGDALPPWGHSPIRIPNSPLHPGPASRPGGRSGGLGSPSTSRFPSRAPRACHPRLQPTPGDGKQPHGNHLLQTSWTLRESFHAECGHRMQHRVTT